MDSRAHSWPCRQLPPGFQLTPTYWHKNLSYEHVLTFGVSRRKCISTTLRVARSLCHCFWDNGAIFHGYSAFSMTYRQFEKTVKNRVSLCCFLSHMFLAHRHNVPQKIHVSLALLLLASLKLFRKWFGPWNVQLLISHASQSTLDEANGTKKRNEQNQRTDKMKKCFHLWIVCIIYFIHGKMLSQI